VRLVTRIFGEENSGRDIVLIHGTGARAEMWRRQIEGLLQRGYRCIVPDLRGHGETGEPGEEAPIAAHLQDVIETLDDVGVAYPAVFAGHSLGAIISLELAQIHPHMVKEILAIAMPGRVPVLTVEAFRVFLGSPYQVLRQTKLHRTLGWRPRVLCETNKHALEQIMLNFASIDYCSNVPTVSCPVHFVVGRLDPVAPYVYATKMHQAMPNSTFHVIEWAGHNSMDSQPRAFDKWFWEKIDDGLRT
jgi:pimeloyl-ACP methyl ester carboxylesterase